MIARVRAKPQDLLVRTMKGAISVPGDPRAWMSTQFGRVTYAQWCEAEVRRINHSGTVKAAVAWSPNRDLVWIARA